MKFPICKVCMKNELLCDGCANKVGEQEIKADEIKMFRLLNEILGSQRSLKDVEIKRILGKNVMIILTRNEDVSKLIGKDGSMVKKLVRKLNMPVRIIGKPSGIGELVNDVLFSVPIIGINVLYKPEGRVYRVRIPKSHRTKLPVSSDILSNISKYLFDKKIDIVFE